RAGLREVHEAAKLPVSAGVIAQQEALKILSPNMSFVLVDFHRDISVANDVRPGFRETNRLWFRRLRNRGKTRFHLSQCNNTVTTSQENRPKCLIRMVPTEGVEPTRPRGHQILSLARLP